MQISDLLPLKELKDLSTDRLAHFFVFVTVILLVLEYFGWQTPFTIFLARYELMQGSSIQEKIFAAQVYTTGCFSVLFVACAVAFNFIIKGGSISEYGLKLPEDDKMWIPYIALAVLMLPVLYTACSSANFYNFYPLYRPDNLSQWLAFEAVYLPQFFCVEFFFRGFGLFWLYKRLGNCSILIMTLPYAMIHIHKPFPEAVASIIAGVVLGSLAIKSKSIWPGVILHCAVAFGTDFFSLYHSGLMGRW